MERAIITIGKSKAVRLPQALLDRYGIADKVELQFEEGRIILKAVEKCAVREGWDIAMMALHQNGDDDLLIDDVFEDETPDEWL